MTTAVATDFWASLMPSVVSDARLSCVRTLAVEAETRRRRADYDTGSIAELEASMLWALAEFVQARVVLEVGTFIGASTMALASAKTVEALYTCDASNDCLPASDVVHVYPKQSSTQMLRHLLTRGVCADLCFFDGALVDEDVELLSRVTHQNTVHAFHDYNYGPKIRRDKRGTVYMETMPRKGIGNVQLLRPITGTHVLVEPLDGTTLALLVPESRL